MKAREITRKSQFFSEALECPAVVANQFEVNARLTAEVGSQLRRSGLELVRTIARGSSACAATFAGYLIETHVGIPVSAAALSVHSRYQANVRLDKALGLSISQSGASPDLLAAAGAVRSAGGLNLALVNEVPSPLAEFAERTVPLRAGREHSVAATKSFIASMAAVLQLVSEWSESEDLRTLVDRAAGQLYVASQLEWHAAVEALVGIDSVIVIARGYGLAVADELALKLAEVCGIKALSYSAAGFEHGPIALIKSGTPVILLSQSDSTQPALADLAGRLLQHGATVLQTGMDVRGTLQLSSVEDHPVLQPLLLAQAAYRLVADLAYARGCDPDVPPLLSKITKTT